MIYTVHHFNVSFFISIIYFIIVCIHVLFHYDIYLLESVKDSILHVWPYISALHLHLRHRNYCHILAALLTHQQILIKLVI